MTVHPSLPVFSTLVSAYWWLKSFWLLPHSVLNTRCLPSLLASIGSSLKCLAQTDILGRYTCDVGFTSGCCEDDPGFGSTTCYPKASCPSTTDYPYTNCCKTAPGMGRTKECYTPSEAPSEAVSSSRCGYMCDCMCDYLCDYICLNFGLAQYSLPSPWPVGFKLVWDILSSGWFLERVLMLGLVRSPFKMVGSQHHHSFVAHFTRNHTWNKRTLVSNPYTTKVWSWSSGLTAIKHAVELKNMLGFFIFKWCKMYAT